MNEHAASMAIDAHGLSKRYEQGRVTALDEVDLHVGSGEWIAICGPSGCGKTTLLNMISAIDTPDAGELRVCERDLRTFRDGDADAFRRDTIGIVFQLHNLLPRLTAYENVLIPRLGGAGGCSQAACGRARMLLERVGLGHRLDALPTTLSGGERQRVAICRALINQPKLLLADEPTGALDSHSGEQLLELLAELQRESGMTLIVVTHDSRVASRAGRIVQMLDGRIV
ncbi:MAG: ABC transporter ATP-binding protein [Phycisphaerae bacterium]